MSTKGFIPFLVAMMLLTGVCNTLLTKYQVYISHFEKKRKPLLTMVQRTCNA